MSEKSSKDILASIREGDAKFLEWLYADNRQSFIFWAAQTYNCTEDMAVEVYQKAFTILYTNARDGKLKELTSTVKTYLFSIGKNLFREQFRSKHNQTLQIDDVGHSIIEGSNLDHKLSDQYQSNHHKKLVSSLLDEIGDPCRQLLKLVYIDGYSTEAVVREMNYSDERVVRKRKSLCLKKMREIVNDKNIEL